MPVELPKNEITPYTSTVPLVNIPPEVIGGTRPSPPLQGQFKGKATSEWVLGDSLLKGFMQGHQINEQKKYAQATATINAADAASEAAYQQYQDALTKAGGNDKDPAAQAAYQSYVTTFNAGKQAKAQFVMPEKGQKGKKAATGSDSGKSSDGKKKQASAGFNSIRDFFEANPHIVPQIALMTMQPKPPGLSPQGQGQVQNLEKQRLQNEEANRKLQNEKIYQTGFSTFSHLSPDEISSLPPDAKKNYEAWQNARAALAPMKYTGATRLYKLSNGKNAWLYPEEAAMYYPDATAITPGSGVRAGSDAELEDKYFESIGVTRDKASAEQLAAATQFARAAKIPNTSTSSTSTTTPQGDRTTTTTRKAAPGAITPPPAASRQASPSQGGITLPPTAGAAPTGQGVPPTAPQGSTQYTVGPKPKGMVEEGNLPIWNRPTVQNGDGSHSSEYSTSFEQDGKEVLVPTVVNGKFLTPDGKKPKPGSLEEKAMFKAARQHYLDTGENLGKFANSKDADAYANTLHSRGEKKAGAKGPITPPPQAGKAAKGGITKAPGGNETWGTTGRAIGFNAARNKAYKDAKQKYDTRITTGVELSPDGTTKTKIDPITAARILAEDQNNLDRDYRTQMKTAKQPPGDIYIYRIDPNTGAALEPKKVPDENTVNVLRKYATQHNKTLETLTDDEIESVLATEKKLGPPPGSQPETQTYGGHTYKLNPKTKQYDRVKETSQ